ncbi:MAG: hypothetical protein HZB42_06345 [Sphingobacteriales bacterium]|nr:hypothetical protein [Sphingobacteriales bacterium]
MFNSIANLCFSFLILTACNNTAKPDKTEKDNMQSDATDTIPPKPGSGRDEHGCIPSAGYTWSVVRNDCIQIWEIGIRMEPQDPKLDKSTAAYLVFTDDKIRVEIFLPTQKKTVIIRKSSAEGEPMKWVNGPLALSESNGTYSLEDEGKLLYRGTVSK